MPNQKFKKVSSICKMCWRIKLLDENKRCYECSKIAIKRKSEAVEYDKQLRKSMGLS